MKYFIRGLLIMMIISMLDYGSSEKVFLKEQDFE